MAVGRKYFEDLTVTYECYLELCSYGVPGSPRWFEPKEIEIIELEIFGHKIDVNCIKRNKQLEKELLYYAGEVEEWD
jgi:hypothetical protein